MCGRSAVESIDLRLAQKGLFSSGGSRSRSCVAQDFRLLATRTSRMRAWVGPHRSSIPWGGASCIRWSANGCTESRPTWAMSGRWPKTIPIATRTCPWSSSGPCLRASSPATCWRLDHPWSSLIYYILLYSTLYIIPISKLSKPLQRS